MRSDIVSYRGYKRAMFITIDDYDQFSLAKICSEEQV